MKTEKIVSKRSLVFKKIKEKERMQFYEFAFESTKENLSKLGVSLNVLKKFCKINRILLGLPAKLIMKNMKDFFVINNGEIVAGYTIIFNKKEDEYELANLFTRPEYQGIGIGNKVMQKIVEEYGEKTISLGVDEKNTIALHLYEKYDFKKKSSMKQFIIELPLKTKNLPENYSARLAVKSDLNFLEKITDNVPDMENLPKIYKNSFNKTKNKKLRLSYQLPVVLLKRNDIVGIARAEWSKGTKETANIIATGIIHDAVDAYPGFIGFITQKLSKMGFTKVIWTNNEKTEPFFNSLKPFIGEPWRNGLKMERKIKNESKNIISSNIT